MREIIMVALGGAAGSVLRYLISINAHHIFGQSRVLTGTFLVNVLGCFLIGFLLTWFETRQILEPQLRLLLMVGFLGGFTTFSTFGLEGFQLLQQSLPTTLLYIAGSVGTGLAALWLGTLLGK